MEGLGFPTETSSAQWELELVARDVYARATRAGANETTTTTTGDGDENARANGARGARGDETDVSGGVAVAATLDRDAHVAYLTRSLTHLGSGFVVLDASRAWLCYWIVHSLALLSHPLAPSTASDVVEFLGKCQRPGGGFGGGPGQMPHLAPTYAAVCCLASIATPEAFACVNRKSLRSFLARCKDDETGGYRMHEGGETDTRGCYTALAVAHLCGIMDDAVTENVSAFVARCQARSVRQTFFTHRSVSTFDRVPFQLMTDEHAHADARRRDRGRAGRGGARRVHVLRARRRRAVRRRARARPPGASALAVHATGRGRGGVQRPHE